MIIQPFIENSIEHGFFNINYKGHIDIQITQTNQRSLEILIKDNGIGLNSNKNTDSIKTKSMATEITKKRLDMLSYETKTKAYFLIREESGVLVTLHVPFKE